MNLVIRLAKPKEARKIAEINLITWKISYFDYIPKEVLETKNITEETIKNRLDNISKNNIFVAEFDNEIIGYASINRNTETEAEISSIYILPQYQRLGIGGTLLKEVLRILKLSNYQKVVIWTMKNFKQSNDFYKKYGGVLTGKIKKWNYNIDIVEFIFIL